jgi:5'-3' exonuclease
MVKPKWLSLCQEYLDKEWNAVRAHGCEVDDLLGMNQTDDTVICSIDKDMLMIPGKHYNFVREEHSIVTPEQGIRNFYEQLLKGDTVDGIPGVRGLGKVKAAKLLANCETEKEMFDVAREQYNDDTTMATYGKCLWIWRKQDDIWNMKDQITGRDLFDEELQE